MYNAAMMKSEVGSFTRVYFLLFIFSPQGRNGKSMSVKEKITKIHVIQMVLFGSEVARLPSQHNG